MAMIRADYISIAAPAQAEISAGMRTLILDHKYFILRFDRTKSFSGNIDALYKILPLKDILRKQFNPIHIICVTAVSQYVLITA